jgi:hypothetical protein
VITSNLNLETNKLLYIYMYVCVCVCGAADKHDILLRIPKCQCSVKTVATTPPPYTIDCGLIELCLTFLGSLMRTEVSRENLLGTKTGSFVSNEESNLLEVRKSNNLNVDCRCSSAGVWTRFKWRNVGSSEGLLCIRYNLPLKQQGISWPILRLVAPLITLLMLS